MAWCGVVCRVGLVVHRRAAQKLFSVPSFEEVRVLWSGVVWCSLVCGMVCGVVSHCLRLLQQLAQCSLSAAAHCCGCASCVTAPAATTGTDAAVHGRTGALQRAFAGRAQLCIECHGTAAAPAGEWTVQFIFVHVCGHVLTFALNATALPLQVTDRQRSLAKGVNYGMTYVSGCVCVCGPRAWASAACWLVTMILLNNPMNCAQGMGAALLAKDMGISQQEAKRFIEVGCSVVRFSVWGI